MLKKRYLNAILSILTINPLACLGSNPVSPYTLKTTAKEYEAYTVPELQRMLLEHNKKMSSFEHDNKKHLKTLDYLLKELNETEKQLRLHYQRHPFRGVSNSTLKKLHDKELNDDDLNSEETEQLKILKTYADEEKPLLLKKFKTEFRLRDLSTEQCDALIERDILTERLNLIEAAIFEKMYRQKSSPEQYAQALHDYQALKYEQEFNAKEMLLHQNLKQLLKKFDNYTGFKTILKDAQNKHKTNPTPASASSLLVKENHFKEHYHKRNEFCIFAHERNNVRIFYNSLVKNYWKDQYSKLNQLVKRPKLHESLKYKNN